MSRAKEPLKPVYAIWGEDRAMVERVVARLAARVAEEGGMDPDRLEAPPATPAEVAAACEAMSFGGLRLVVVRVVESWKAGDLAPLLGYLADPNPASCLALESTGTLPPQLVRAVEAVGQVLAYGPDPKARRGERAKWFAEHVSREVGRAGGRITAALAREVVSRVGEDAMALSQEAAKLVAYAGGEPVSREALDAVVVAHPEARVYELADALVAGRADRAYDLLQDLATGDQAQAPIVIQSVLARHYRAVAEAQALGPEATPDEVGAVTGLRGFPAQKAVEQARGLPAGAGQRAVVRLAALELDLRVSSLNELGRSSDDGRRLVLELAARALLALARPGAGVR